MSNHAEEMVTTPTGTKTTKGAGEICEVGTIFPGEVTIQVGQKMGRNKPCYKCGRKFGPNHLQSCTAKTNSAQNALNEVILQNYADQ